jgi:DNA-directed RNA polymerase subunit K/omega
MGITKDLRDIYKKGDTIYKAVVVSAKRARQIHAKLNDALKKHLGELENDEDLDETSVDREKIIKEFDKKDKSSSLALDEYLDDKIQVTMKETKPKSDSTKGPSKNSVE